MEKIGVGVIGLGVGEQHARVAMNHPHAHLVAICDRNADKLSKISSQLSPSKAYGDANDLIEDPEVELVSIASNDDDHYPQIVRALKKGKHVFAEKPLCLKESELKEIHAVWKGAQGPRLTTNTILRLSPRFRELKEKINHGELGTVYCIEADYVYGRFHKIISGWRGEISDYSVTLGGGIHMVDLILWMSGQLPVEVVALGSSLASASTSFKGNDLTVALLKFANGLVAKVSSNFASVHPHYHRFLAYGTKGTFENTVGSPGSEARLWKSSDPALLPENLNWPYPAVGKGELLLRFINEIVEGKESQISEKEVFSALSVCLAIDQSIREKRAVQVQYLS